MHLKSVGRKHAVNWDYERENYWDSTGKVNEYSSPSILDLSPRIE